MSSKSKVGRGFGKLTKAERNEKIRQMYSTGKYSHRSLALRVGLSKSQIGVIVG